MCDEVGRVIVRRRGVVIPPCTMRVCWSLLFSFSLCLSVSTFLSLVICLSLYSILCFSLCVRLRLPVYLHVSTCMTLPPLFRSVYPSLNYARR